MTDDELAFLDATAVARLLHTRKLSPVELTRALLARIDKLEPRLGAYALVTPEIALAQAKDAETLLMQHRILSPLHGVPIGLKDLHHTKGIRTMAGMPIHRDFVPAFDGTIVSRLRDAGTVLLGKLQMTEGAFADHHPAVRVPVNPWHRDHWSGASSSGTGVALAAGLCFAATGTDTGGSIRFPAAANGVTGLKPTWGRVSVLLSAGRQTHLRAISRCSGRSRLTRRFQLDEAFGLLLPGAQEAFGVAVVVDGVL